MQSAILNMIDLAYLVISKFGRPTFYAIFKNENIGVKETMKIGLMIGGAFLIICSIIGHNSIPGIISHANSLVSPLEGGMNCGTNTGASCMDLTFVKTTFEVSTTSLGLIGILLIGYGGLSSKIKEENFGTAKTKSPTIKILEDLFA